MRKILRFDRVERVAHWTNATLFLILIATGASLKVAGLSTIVANRHTVKEIHVYSGLLLPFPVLLGIAFPIGRQFRRDLARFNRWTNDDKRWWSRRTRADVQLGKFNPGQKLNAIFIGASIVVMLMTGAIMRWPDRFSDSWRTGATFVHDSTWLALIIVIVGHIGFALRDSDSLRSMIKGWVPESWARRERPRWWAEVVTNSANAVGDVNARGDERVGEAGVGAREVSVGEVVEPGTHGLGGRDL
jgi:formate dehydrogenase subunit gamma